MWLRQRFLSSLCVCLFTAGAGTSEKAAGAGRASEPAVEYCSFIGGSGDDWAFGVTTDAAGNVYLGGNTDSRTYPVTPGAFTIRNPGDQESFLTKLDPTGEKMLYSALIGGTGGDYAGRPAVDGSGNAWLSGNTNSSDLPVTPNAVCPSYRGPAGALHGDIFVARLSAAGDSLIDCTYFGGSGIDNQGGLAAGADGSAIAAGNTASADLPVTTSAFDRSRHGGNDAFVVKFNPDGSLAYCTVLGGGGEDLAPLAVLGADGNAVIAGTTTSDDFPVTGNPPGSSVAGEADIFVTKFNATGTGLIFSVRFGGRKEDCPMAVALDAEGNIHLAGYTRSDDYPATFRPGGAAPGGRKDAFYTVLSPAGDLIRSAVFGGSGDEEATGLAVDRAGRVFISGTTASRDFPVTDNATDRVFNGGAAAWERGGDAFLSCLDPEGTGFFFSTYFGGRQDEFFTGVALGDSDAVFLSGTTASNDLPVSSEAMDRTRGGTHDAFIVRLRIPDVSAAVPAVGMEGPAAGFRLSPNFPNPFNPSTAVRYVLERPGRVSVNVTDLRGGRVKSLADGWHAAGSHTARWDGTDDSGRPAASGVYLAEMTAGRSRQCRKITLLR